MCLGAMAVGASRAVELSHRHVDNKKKHYQYSTPTIPVEGFFPTGRRRSDVPLP